eukprot:Skav204108  [mRNA]  locus=scaffold3280:27744:28421:- [translate_table: standard]
MTLHLSDEAENLGLSSVAGGTKFRLMLLKKERLRASNEIPDALNQPVPECMKKNAESDEEEDVKDEHDQGDMTEEQAKALEDEQFEAEHHGLEADDDQLMILADSDDDEAALDIPMEVSTTKVKSFFLREAWSKLEKMDLVLIPRHIRGCSIGYHQQNRQWHGFYPGLSKSLTSVWGGTTKRKEEESILKVVRTIIEAYLKAHPKDSGWLKQLNKVTHAEATLSF